MLPKCFPKKAVPIYNVISHTAEDPLHCLVPLALRGQNRLESTNTEVSKC